jgi:hypothetical protein
MFCHACGTENEDGSRFCRSCGAPQIAAAPEPAPEPEPVVAQSPQASADEAKVCPTCNTEFPPALKFCDRDGTALVTVAISAAPSQPVALAPAEPAAEPEPAPTPEPTPKPEPELPVDASPASAALTLQFCDACGSQLLPEDAFCSECGARNEPLDQARVAQPVPPIAVEVTAPDAEQARAPEPQATEPDPGSVPDETAAAAPAQDAEAVPPESEEQSGDAGDETHPWLATAPVATGEEGAGIADEAAFEYEPAEPDEKGRGILVWGIAGLVLLGVAGGAGYVWRDRVAALAGLDSGASDTAEADEAKSGVPRVAGTYTAYLMDQEIEISFEGDPAVLAESKGTARYFNTVNGGRCVSRLVAIKSGGIGGEPSGKVLFSQQPKDGEPPCGKDIPMLIDIDKQAMGDNGLVSRLAIEWQSPETKEVLMSGNLDMAE